MVGTPHPQAKYSGQAPGRRRKANAPTTRVPAQVPENAGATPQRPPGSRVRGRSRDALQMQNVSLASRRKEEEVRAAAAGGAVAGRPGV